MCVCVCVCREGESSIYIIILCLTDTTNQAHKCGSNCIELAAKADIERRQGRQREREKEGEDRGRTEAEIQVIWQATYISRAAHRTTRQTDRKAEQLDSWPKIKSECERQCYQSSCFADKTNFFSSPVVYKKSKIRHTILFKSVWLPSHFFSW